jgi:hypothetical protein
MIVILNNSLKGLPSNPIEPSKKMQQGIDLLSLCFINDFHWRQKQNKGKQNKRSALVVQNSTSPSRLSWNVGQHKEPFLV